jgi:hypothetical protein
MVVSDPGAGSVAGAPPDDLPPLNVDSSVAAEDITREIKFLDMRLRLTKKGPTRIFEFVFVKADFHRFIWFQSLS